MGIGMNKLHISAAAALSLFCTNASAAVDAGGFTFANNAFADAVVAYAVGDPAPQPQFQDPSQALGAPDAEPGEVRGVALGSGGSLVLQFVDNRLVGDGTTAPDLIIFEGGSPEDSFIELSVDGVAFFSAGTALGGIAALDIDAALAAVGLPASTRIAFVRLTDDPNQGSRNSSSVGSDIDAIGALSSVAVPIPAAALLFAPALAMLRRRRG